MSIFNHFRPEERIFVERVMEWAKLVQTRFSTKLTPFLDPREQFIVQAIVGRETDILVSFHGGYEQAERKRACIYPEFLEGSAIDHELTLLSLEVKQKQGRLEHRDVLGSLLGLGLKREKFGDILLTDQLTQCIVAEDIAQYVEIHLQQINRYSVSCTELYWQELSIPDEHWHYRETTVSSMRLDTVLSELLRLSRTKVIPLIKGGRVKVNWKLIEQPAFQLEEGDQLSVKGYGRFLFAKVEGQTKKQKYRVTLGRKE